MTDPTTKPQYQSILMGVALIKSIEGAYKAKLPEEQIADIFKSGLKAMRTFAFAEAYTSVIGANSGKLLVRAQEADHKAEQARKQFELLLEVILNEAEKKQDVA